MANSDNVSTSTVEDFGDDLTEVYSTPGGKAFMRCGAKVIPLDSINSLQPYRPKHKEGEACGTIVYYSGLGGTALTWFWSSPYDEVMEVFASSCRILASTEDEMDD